MILRKQISLAVVGIAVLVGVILIQKSDDNVLPEGEDTVIAESITFQPAEEQTADEDGFQTRRYYLSEKVAKNNPKLFLAENGVEFPTGASIEVDEETEEIIVQNAPYQQLMVKAVVEWSDSRGGQRLREEEAAVARNQQLLDELLISKVEFKDTDLETALETLHKLGVEVLLGEGRSADELVPFGFGRDNHPIFSEKDFAELKKTPITLRLHNVPLNEALRYTASLAYLQYKVYPDTIGLEPISLGEGHLFTNVYVPPSDFVALMKQSEADIKTVFVNAGIPFPTGTLAVFDSDSDQLIVRNYPDKHERIREYLESTQMEWTEPMREAGRRRLVDLLHEERIPLIDWENVPLGVAIQFLNHYARKLDFEFYRTSFSGRQNIIQGEWKEFDPSENRISLRVTNITLLDALLKTCELSGCQCDVDIDGIHITSSP
ncbi:MAG: hypothetical protein CMO55_06425 [Verrucomicrobiales bacterium]|nr:hypothetical protein [Verrucomicrobiales bacterium]